MVQPEENGDLTSVQRRRLQDRKEWEAFWKVRKLDAEGGIAPTVRYYAHRVFDFPATWFRENIVEPLHDRFKMPYYQRRLTRVPEIDQCGVNDQVRFEIMTHIEFRFFRHVSLRQMNNIV